MGDMLKDLRRDFDQAFAAAAAPTRSRGTQFVALSLGSLQVAVRLSELAGIHLCPPLIPVALAPDFILGMVGIRGRVVPVVDLAQRLELPPVRVFRWLAVARAEHDIAFAFERFDGYADVDLARIRKVPQGTERRHLHEVADLPSGPKPVLSLESVRLELEAQGAR